MYASITDEILALGAELAFERSANRLTTAVANYLAGDETDSERDCRHHDDRSLTVHTDADGMVIIRAALPPNIGKPIVAAITAVVQRVATTPYDHSGHESGDDHGSGASADAGVSQTVAELSTYCGEGASAAAPSHPTMSEQLRELRRRWQPADSDEFFFPSLAQQRADAFVLMFLGSNIDILTEVVIHVRADGVTFDDGTPLTELEPRCAPCHRARHRREPGLAPAAA